MEVEKEQEGDEREEQEDGEGGRTPIVFTSMQSEAEIDGIFGELFAYLGMAYYRITLSLKDPRVLFEMDIFLTTLLRQWRAVKHVFSESQQVGVGLALACLSVMVHRARGNMDEALTGALIFSEIVGHPLSPFLPILQQGAWHPKPWIDKTTE